MTLEKNAEFNNFLTSQRPNALTILARYTGPQNKYLKKFGLLPEPPQKFGRRKRRRKVSDYGIRLKEKQKLKFIYGVLERQFRRYFEKARENPRNTQELLLQFLECRLDNVLYRLGFAKTRRQARQLVNHGHVLVDDGKVDICSYNVKIGQVITVRSKSLKIPFVQESLKEAKPSRLPVWLERKGPVARVKKLPEQEDLRTDIDVSLIVEYYSR